MAHNAPTSHVLGTGPGRAVSCPETPHGSPLPSTLKATPGRAAFCHATWFMLWKRVPLPADLGGLL